ncbi:MAG: Mobile element protein [Hydrogenibacillus schlegelii]|uniref:Mutator family transposase n=1 Tax=Hydrogenibacillus schlegelii TaxID=1484 RepID=A0A2T5GCA0_HYDSH|nr:MAG: Mobile element protein [Hydrogenibacillus schlegelii]
MTSDFKIALRDLLRKSQGEPEADALREALRRLAQELMELEVSELVGAQRYERAKKRKAYRNGDRSRLWDTRLGTIELKIPKLRQAAPSPAFWSGAGEPRKPWWPSFKRPTFTASTPERGTSWHGHRAWMGWWGAKSPGSVRIWTSG